MACVRRTFVDMSVSQNDPAGARRLATVAPANDRVVCAQSATLLVPGPPQALSVVLAPASVTVPLMPPTVTGSTRPPASRNAEQAPSYRNVAVRSPSDVSVRWQSPLDDGGGRAGPLLVRRSADRQPKERRRGRGCGAMRSHDARDAEQA